MKPASASPASLKKRREKMDKDDFYADCEFDEVEYERIREKIAMVLSWYGEDCAIRGHDEQKRIKALNSILALDGIEIRADNQSIPYDTIIKLRGKWQVVFAKDTIAGLVKVVPKPKTQ